MNLAEVVYRLNAFVRPKHNFSAVLFIQILFIPKQILNDITLENVWIFMKIEQVRFKKEFLIKNGWCTSPNVNITSGPESR